MSGLSTLHCLYGIQTNFQICQKMGWKGKGGMFDVLPLVLQANGADPELFEIPPDLVLEVAFKHPEYDLIFLP